MIGVYVYAAIATLVALAVLVPCGLLALGAAIEVAHDWGAWPPGWGAVILTVVGCVIAVGGPLGQYLDWQERRRRLMNLREIVEAGLAHLVNQDDYGRLWRINRASNQEAICVVEVVNMTPNPLGSYDRYFLRVPPSVRSAREAVAWTFGFGSAGEYRPAIES